MKHLKLISSSTALLMSIFCFSWAWAQENVPASKSIPSGYYNDADGKSGYTLKTALHNIIDNHTTVSYDGLWDAFEDTDRKDNGKVWDMYSDCTWSFGSGQCGNYKNECDCYNREHSFPKSWFDDAKPMYSDLFHLYPTDGKVNGMRSNYPFGEVGSATYTSKNGSKLGQSITPGYSGKVFEPVDEYKGDFARSYFYMATRYEDKIANWDNCPICNGSSTQAFDDWVVDLLLKWHREDPVSQKEIDRNDAVYKHQKNRNPFIDYPVLVEKIWGDDDTPFDLDNPNPDPEPEPGQDVYRMPYAYSTLSGDILLRDTLEVYTSSTKAKSAALSILNPADGMEVYEENVAGKVRLSGYTPDALNKDYTLKTVTLIFDTQYRLEVALEKNGERMASATSTFKVVDTTSIETEPDAEDTLSYMITYTYKDADGVAFVIDTQYVNQKHGVEQMLTRIESQRNTETLLWEEDFENLSGADNSGTPASSNDCEYVSSFEGKVYAVNSGVRLASGSGNGVIVFNEFKADSDFSVEISGKGWDADELTAEVECVGCTQPSQTITFSKSKEDLAGGQYEELPALGFSPSEEGGNVTLKVTAASGKRVFIGKVSVKGNGSSPDPDPDPDPEPTPSDTLVYDWDEFMIVNPRQAQELLLSTVTPRLAMGNSARPDDEPDYVKLPEQKLTRGKAYFLQVQLWFKGEKLDEQSVGFSVKKDEEDVANSMESAMKVHVYPNPSSGIFYVELPDNSRMEIFSATGRLVESRPVVSGKQEVNLEHSGLYLIRVVKGDRWMVKRILVR